MDKQRPTDRQVTPTDSKSKKPYRKPRLQEYGDLRKITAAGKASNRSDGGTAPATKR